MTHIKRKKGGLGKLFIIAYRNIYRNKRRTLFCIIAISVTVFFIIAMAAFMDGFMDNFRKQIIAYETGHVLISSREFEKKSFFLPLQYPLEVPEKDLSAVMEELSTIQGVGHVSPRIKTHVSLLNSVIKSALLWGIDMETELKHTIFNYKTKNADKCLVEGRFPSGLANECAIGFRLAKKMGVDIGDKIQMKIISSEFSSKYFFPVITGITDFNMSEMDRNAIIIPFARLQKLATLSGKTQVIAVYADKDRNIPGMTAGVENLFAHNPDVSVKPYKKHAFLVLLEISDVMMALIYIVFMIVASFLIINTIIMTIHERIKEIGMMAALGMTRSEIVSVFFLESLVLSLLGSLIGCLVGGILTFSLSKVPIEFGVLWEEIMAMNNTLYVTFSPAIIGQGLMYGLLISAVCTILPSLKSAFIKPVEALRR